MKAEVYVLENEDLIEFQAELQELLNTGWEAKWETFKIHAAEDRSELNWYIIILVMEKA